MGRLIAVFCVLALAPTATSDWTAVAKKTGDSIVRIETGDKTCTGFVIADDVPGNRDAVLTAAHCAGPDLFADSAVARVIYKNVKADLMILDVSDTGRPAITVAKDNPAIGEEVGSYGFGYALERPMFRLAHVSDDEAQLPEVEGGPFIMIDAAYVPGQSGGAVVNAAGEVVSIVQQGTDRAGIGVGAKTLRSKIGRYLPKPKP